MRVCRKDWNNFTIKTNNREKNVINICITFSKLNLIDFYHMVSKYHFLWTRGKVVHVAISENICVQILKMMLKVTSHLSTISNNHNRYNNKASCNNCQREHVCHQWQQLSVHSGDTCLSVKQFCMVAYTCHCHSVICASVQSQIMVIKTFVYDCNLNNRKIRRKTFCSFVLLHSAYFLL